VGQWDPAITLEKGYVPESFREGPLTLAMKSGGALLINELNRMPESVQNILLPALDEDRIEIPGVGSVAGAPGFFVVATQNPREYVATHSLSEALLDRFDWLEIEYPDRDEELEILRTQGPQGATRLSEAWRRLLVDSIRETRGHKSVKRGASIRAALAWADWIVAHAETGSPAYSDQLSLNRDLYLSSGVAVLANRVEWASVPTGKGNRTGMIRQILETFWDEWVGTDARPDDDGSGSGKKKP
jgi:MoxR-like ATPase